jgi:polar amino acid transport system substrate-binding protein
MHGPIIILLLGLMASGFAHTKQIIIASINQQVPRLIVSESVMSQIYQRLGHTMTMVNYPAKRSLLEVNIGSANGELARAEMIEADNPNLIRIPYSIGRVKVVAIQAKNSPKVSQIAELKNYRVGIMRGFVATEKMSEHLSRIMYNDIHGLLKGIMSGRVDVGLFTELGAKHFIRKYTFEDKLVISDKPLVEIPLYHYLHNNSNKIAQTLIIKMQEMHTSGQLQDLIRVEESKFIDANSQ